jgi:hypothetical protein
MATTTPNYGWDVPTSTDYVKDGATAIETLGDDIDATLFSVTGGKTVGYQLLTSGTLTTASQLIMDNITSAYRNYKFIFSGTTSVQQGNFGLNLRNSTGNLIGSFYNVIQMTHATNSTSVIGAGSMAGSNGAAIGQGGNSGCSLILEIETEAGNPTWMARATGLFDGAAQNQNITSGSYGATVSGGITGIRVFPVTGTLSGTYQLYGAKA